MFVIVVVTGPFGHHSWASLNVEHLRSGFRPFGPIAAFSLTALLDLEFSQLVAARLSTCVINGY